MISLRYFIQFLDDLTHEVLTLIAGQSGWEAIVHNELVKKGVRRFPRGLISSRKCLDVAVK